jgi:predicted lipoprotein with Yx(FWY)xxD motif
LRVWLGEVDRALRLRSRVGLLLVTIAVGAAGVALYLAIDASQQSARTGDVQRLQGQIDALRSEASQATQLNGRLATARSLAGRASAEVAKLKAQVQGFQQKATAAARAPSRGAGSSPGTGPASSSTGSKGPATGARKSSSAAGATVSVAGNPKLGTIIVDSHGLTLYDFHRDEGAKSACYGACASVWPPLKTSGTPQTTGGVEASKLGTAKRTDGTTQVTYGGRPLYTYAGDRKPGDAKGNGITSFGGSWHALHPNGKEAGG